MLRIALLTAVSVAALGTAHAEDAAANPANNSQTAFQSAVHSIKSWFGSDTAVVVTPIATADDSIQMPPPVVGDAASAAAIEPAAGDDDMLQVPPPYTGVNAMAPAAGDATPMDTSKMDCTKILKAAKNAEEGAETPDTAMIEACSKVAPTATDTTPTPVDPSIPNTAPVSEPSKLPAMPQPLPSTQPAAGTPAPAAPAAK